MGGDTAVPSSCSPLAAYTPATSRKVDTPTWLQASSRESHRWRGSCRVAGSLLLDCHIPYLDRLHIPVCMAGWLVQLSASGSARLTPLCM